MATPLFAGLAGAGSSLARGLLAARQAKLAQAQQEEENKRAAAEIDLQRQQLASQSTREQFQDWLATQNLELDRQRLAQEATQKQAGTWVKVSAEPGAKGFVLYNSATAEFKTFDVDPSYLPQKVGQIKIVPGTALGPDGKPTDAAYAMTSTGDGSYSIAVIPQSIGQKALVDSYVANQTTSTSTIDLISGLTTTTNKTVTRGKGNEPNLAPKAAPSSSPPPSQPSPQIKSWALSVANGAVSLSSIPAKYRALVQQEVARLTGTYKQQFQDAANAALADPRNLQKRAALISAVQAAAKGEGKSGAQIKALTDSIADPGAWFGLGAQTKRQAAIANAASALGVTVGPAKLSPAAQALKGGSK